MILRDLKPGDVFRFRNSLWTKTAKGDFFHIACLSPESKGVPHKDSPRVCDEEEKVDYIQPIVKGLF